MDAELDAIIGDYTSKKIHTLANAVYFRLTTPRGSWWGDVSLGSDLHELMRSKDTNGVTSLAEQHVKAALEPLVQDGRIKRLVVKAEKVQDSPYCTIHIEIKTPIEQTYMYKHTVRVS